MFAGLFLGYILLPWINLSILSPIPHCLCYCNFIVNLDSGRISTLTLFLFHIVLTTLGLLPPHKLIISLSISTKKLSGFLLGLHCLCRQVGKNWHLDNTILDPWTWNISPFIQFLDLFHQSFNIFFMWFKHIC